MCSSVRTGASDSMPSSLPLLLSPTGTSRTARMMNSFLAAMVAAKSCKARVETVKDSERQPDGVKAHLPAHEGVINTVESVQYGRICRSGKAKARVGTNPKLGYCLEQLHCEENETRGW